MLIGDLLAHRARSSPERPYWEEGGRSWSYAEIDAAATRVARAMLAGGLAPGDHAAIQAANGPAYLAAHFGAARAGVVLAHLNTHYQAGETARLIGHSDARLVFFSPTCAGTLAQARGDCPEVRHWVALPEGDLEAPTPAPPWAVPLAGWSEAPRALALPSLDPGTPFQLLYTSGTTGQPKAALISHQAKFRQGTTHALNLGLQPGDRLFSSLPLYHQFAQWLLLVSVPIAGATVVARNGFDPADALRALAHEGITHLPAVPTMLYRLLDHASGEPQDDEAVGKEGIIQAPHLRCIVYGGAPVAESRVPMLRRAFPGVRLFQGFGQTETGYCLGLHDDDHDHRPEALGRPDVFSEVRLVNERGEDVPEGEVGEIVARTPYLMQGYHKHPEATAAYFAFGPEWGRTGDLAFRDAQGYFTLAGRKDDLIISGGVNIYPAEIEQVLQIHPDVAEAAVLGLPDAEWGEQVAAALLLRPGATLDEAALIHHCRKSLANFKQPRTFHVLESLPRTPSGKIRKFELKALLLDDGQSREPEPVC